MKIIIDLDENIFVRLYDNGIDMNKEDLRDICKSIRNGKSIEERLYGKWIIISEDTEGIHHIKCPFCKYEKGSEFTPFIKVTFDKLPYFCEKCGAKLDRGEQ